MSRTRESVRVAAKRKELFEEIKKRVEAFNGNEAGMYVSLIQLGWDQRQTITPHRFQRELLRAEVAKTRASELRVILEAADAVVPAFLAGKLSVRDALEKARAVRRDRRELSDEDQAQDEQPEFQSEARQAQEQITAAAERFIRILTTTCKPEDNTWTCECGRWRFEFRPSAGFLAELQKITPS